MNNEAEKIPRKISSQCLRFGTDALPEKLVKYVNSIVKLTEAQPIMIVMSILCMVSAFVKHSCFMSEIDTMFGNGGYFQTLYPNLWVLSISQSGSFKTTALNKGFKLAFEHDSQDILDIDNKLSRILLPNRTTTEGLLEDLADGCGGAIICSEFGAWLQTLERTYNQGLKPLLTDLYDVPVRYSYKTKSEGRKELCEPFITVCGVSTIEWIKKNVVMDDISTGFFARFLIFLPPQSSKVPPALPISGPRIDQKSKSEIKKILEKLPEKPRAYHLSDKAKEGFNHFHNKLYEIFQDYRESAQEILSPYLKRWSPYVLKIAMLLQLFIDETTDEISLEALKGAIYIVVHAVNSTVWLFENELGESEHQRKVRKVQEYSKVNIFLWPVKPEVASSSLVTPAILMKAYHASDRLFSYYRTFFSS